MIPFYTVLVYLSSAQAQSSNDDVYQVPMQYVTEKHIFGDAYEVNHFSAHLCGGCLFDGQQAVVSLILQKQAWNQTISDILKAEVIDVHGTVRASNENNETGNHEETFSFIYHKAYGDLNIRVENGAGDGMIYTLALKFKQSHQKKALAANCEKRWIMNLFESRAQWKYSETVKMKSEVMHELIPIFKMSTPYSVISHELKFLQLDYCFPHITSYKLMIAVVADDEDSAFATYACPKSIKDCSTRNAPFHDTTGSASNFVQVKVNGAKDIGPVKVIVRGDGRFKQKNTFTLAASKYIEA